MRLCSRDIFIIVNIIFGRWFLHGGSENHKIMVYAVALQNLILSPFVVTPTSHLTIIIISIIYCVIYSIMFFFKLFYLIPDTGGVYNFNILKKAFFSFFASRTLCYL